MANGTVYRVLPFLGCLDFLGYFKQGISLLNIVCLFIFSVFPKDFVGSIRAENPW